MILSEGAFFVGSRRTVARKYTMSKNRILKRESQECAKVH